MALYNQFRAESDGLGGVAGITEEQHIPHDGSSGNATRASCCQVEGGVPGLTDCAASVGAIAWMAPEWHCEPYAAAAAHEILREEPRDPEETHGHRATSYRAGAAETALP